MVSLVVVVCAIIFVYVIRKGKKEKKNWSNQASKVICLGGLLYILILLSIAMFSVIQKDYTGYYKSRIETLTQENKQMDKWREIIREGLEEEPELLNYMEEHFAEKMEENAKEIEECMNSQENIVPLYKFLLYFG